MSVTAHGQPTNASGKLWNMAAEDGAGVRAWMMVGLVAYTLLVNVIMLMGVVSVSGCTGRKRRRSMSPYDSRYDPRPRYDDYGTSTIYKHSHVCITRRNYACLSQTPTGTTARHHEADTHVPRRTRTCLITLRHSNSLRSGSDTSILNRLPKRTMQTSSLSKKPATALNHATASSPSGRSTKRSLQRIRSSTISFSCCYLFCYMFVFAYKHGVRVTET
jgi:hypothetical protein